METDSVAIISALADAGVEFIVIGGIAGQLLGSPVVTYDFDVCYRRERENLERMAVVLRSLKATLRGAPPEVPFQLDARTLQNGDSFTFDTAFGGFDILGTPSGTTGYDDLKRTAVDVEIEGRRVLVTSIDDLIRMKRAAGRTKDLMAVEELGALRARRDHGS